jgi:hypothetical protein
MPREPNTKLAWAVMMCYANETSYKHCRQVIPANYQPYYGKFLRITVRANPSGTCTLSGSSVGLRDGDTSAFTATPTRITWGGGNNSVVTTAGAYARYTSDWIPYVWDPTVVHLVNLSWVTDGGKTMFASNYGQYAYYEQSSAVDRTMEINPSFQGGDLNGMGLEIIEIASDITNYLINRRDRFRKSGISLG